MPPTTSRTPPSSQGSTRSPPSVRPTIPWPCSTQREPVTAPVSSPTPSRCTGARSSSGSRSPLRGEAVIQLASTLRNLERVDEAIALLEGLVAEEPRHPLADSANAFLALCLSSRGDDRAALATRAHDARAAAAALRALGGGVRGGAARRLTFPRPEPETAESAALGSESDRIAPWGAGSPAECAQIGPTLRFAGLRPFDVASRIEVTQTRGIRRHSAHLRRLDRQLVAATTATAPPHEGATPSSRAW